MKGGRGGGLRRSREDETSAVVELKLRNRMKYNIYSI